MSFGMALVVDNKPGTREPNRTGMNLGCFTRPCHQESCRPKVWTPSGDVGVLLSAITDADHWALMLADGTGGWD